MTEAGVVMQLGWHWCLSVQSVVGDTSHSRPYRDGYDRLTW